MGVRVDLGVVWQAVWSRDEDKYLYSSNMPLPHLVTRRTRFTPGPTWAAASTRVNFEASHCKLQLEPLTRVRFASRKRLDQDPFSCLTLWFSADAVWLSDTKLLSIIRRLSGACCAGLDLQGSRKLFSLRVPGSGVVRATGDLPSRLASSLLLQSFTYERRYPSVDCLTMLLPSLRSPKVSPSFVLKKVR